MVRVKVKEFALDVGRGHNQDRMRVVDSGRAGTWLFSQRNFS